MSFGVLTTVIGLVVIASLVGGFVPYTFRLTHTRLQMLLSFVGGALIGVGVLHMLPHATLELGSIDMSVTAVLAGLVGMFFLTRIFHVHHHGSVDEHSHENHEHDHADAAIDCELHDRPMSWIALAVGLGFHSLLDGVALASSFEVSRHGDQSIWLLGAGATLDADDKDGATPLHLAAQNGRLAVVERLSMFKDKFCLGSTRKHH